MSNMEFRWYGSGYVHNCRGGHPWMCQKNHGLLLTLIRDDHQHLVQRHLSVDNTKAHILSDNYVSEVKMSRAQQDLVSGAGSPLAFMRSVCTTSRVRS